MSVTGKSALPFAASRAVRCQGSSILSPHNLNLTLNTNRIARSETRRVISVLLTPFVTLTWPRDSFVLDLEEYHLSDPLHQH